MANICMDCLNWRKCPWSKNLSLPFEKRERPPHVDGKPDFDVRIIGSDKNIRYDIRACPMYEDERPVRVRSSQLAAPLNSTENEKFLKDPIAYINSHTNAEAFSAAHKRMEAIKQTQYKKKIPSDDEELDEKVEENRKLVNSLRAIARDTNVPVITATQKKTKTTEGRGRPKRKIKEE